MTVPISDRVWEYWESAALLDEPSVVMIFSSELSQEVALDAVRRAASETMREREARFDAPGGQDEPRTGHWALAPVPGGVALRIDEEPHDFQDLVRSIAVQLEAAGVEGALDLYEPETFVDVPDVIDLLECRLRVNGQRYHLRGHKWRWRADPDAFAASLAVGIDWCRANGVQLPLSLVVGLIASSTLSAEDDVAAYMREALELTDEVGVVHLTSAAPDRFRTLSVDASKGRLTLIEGGATIEAVGWQHSARGLRSVLDLASAWAVYGFIKRGSHRPAAIQGSSLSQDWVNVPHFDAATLAGEAFENEYVPDAFAVQLLGKGYAARVPSGPDWTCLPAGEDAMIVEHADPGAWFDGRLVPFGGHPSSTSAAAEPIPGVVARARLDFADILFTNDVARGR